MWLAVVTMASLLVVCKASHCLHLDFVLTWMTSREGVGIHYFSIAAVTNYHKLGGFDEVIFLQFWRSEAWHASPWAKIKVQAGLHSFPEALEEYPFPCLLQFLEASRIGWWCLPPSWKPAALPISDPGFLVTFLKLSFASLFNCEGLLWSHWLVHLIQNILPIPRSLI